MTTKDYILDNNPPKGSPSRRDSEDKAESLVNTHESSNEQTPQQQEKKNLTYAEMFEKLNPKPDPKRLKEDAKRARTRNVITALGDGISTLANLYYTTKGAPNMLDGKNTLSAKSQARYDKLIQDYKDNLEKYRQGRLKAEQLDKEWNYRAERDKVGDEQWNKSHQLGLDKFEYQKERDKVGDDRYTVEQEHRAEREAKADEQWNKSFNLQKQTQQDNKQFRQDQIDAQNKRTEAARAKGVRGKETVFSDGKGNNVIIYDNVWKGSKQSIINALSEDPQFHDNLLLRKINRGIATKDEVDNFINQNWSKSDKAKAIMLTLSQLDPATMTSEIDNDSDEDFSQYEVTSDDDFSQYEVK